MTNNEAIKIWWAFFWRMVFFWMFVCAPVFEISRHYIRLLELEYNLTGILIEFIGMSAIVLTSFATMRYVLKKKYKGFSIQIDRN